MFQASFFLACMEIIEKVVEAVCLGKGDGNVT